MKKLSKKTRQFVSAGVGLGIGTAVIAGTGQGASITPAFAAAGGMMRPVGTAMMGGAALGMLKKYPKMYKKKRRY